MPARLPNSSYGVMKKSLLQLSIGVIGVALAMLTFIGTNTRHISALAGWLTYTTAAYITGGVLVVVALVWLLMRLRALPWTGNHGERLRIKKLNSSIYYGIGLLVVACWATAIVNAQSKAKPVPLSRISKTLPFDTTIKDSRILIMPFMKTCTYEGRSIDIGNAIRDRLEKLRISDSLNIQIRYFADSIDLSNYTPAIADSLMKLTGATDILSGTYSLRECEGSALNRLSFHHRTDYKNVHKEIEHLDNENKILKFDSVDDIREGIGLQSMDDMIYFVAGLADYRSGKYQSAIARYKKIQDYQHNAPLLFDIGNCYLVLKDHQQTRLYYELCFQADPTYAEALAHISWLEMAQKRYDNARRLLENALKADPDNYCANNSLGGLYLKLKDTVRAEACFQSLVHHHPKDDALMFRMAKTFMSIGDYQSARVLLEKAFPIHPSHPGLWNLLGKVHFILRNEKTATECFENALRFNKRDANAWNNLGVLHQMNNRFTEAIDCFVTATNINPKLQEPWIAMAECYLELDNEQAAFNTLQEALSKDRKAEKVLLYTADLYSTRGQYQNAGFHYLALTNLRPSNASYLLQLAMCYYAQSDYRSALAMYRRAHLLQPDNAVVLYKMARSASQLNDASHAVEYLSQALERAPELMRMAANDHAFAWMATDKNFSMLIKNDSLGTKSYFETPAYYLPLLPAARPYFRESTVKRPTLL